MRGAHKKKDRKNKLSASKIGIEKGLLPYRLTRGKKLDKYTKRTTNTTITKKGKKKGNRKRKKEKKKRKRKGKKRKEEEMSLFPS